MLEFRFRWKDMQVQTAIRWVGLGVLSVSLVCQIGCVTLMGKKRSSKLDTTYLEAAGYSIPPGGMPSPVGEIASDGQSLVMEIRQDGEKPHMERIPLSKDGPCLSRHWCKKPRSTSVSAA